MDFDYGTIGYHWWGDYDIGKGMADQVVDALVNDGTFRVIERKKLNTVLAEQDFSNSDRADPSAGKLAKIGKVLGVKYIISGSITKFGGEEKNYGGGAIGGHHLGGLGLKKAKTEVSLTARLIDTSSGEVVVSATGSVLEGRRPLGGALGGGRSRVQHEPSDYKASAIGEAQAMACKELVASSWRRRTSSSRNPLRHSAAAAARAAAFFVALWRPRHDPEPSMSAPVFTIANQPPPGGAGAAS
jgi:curli biogenesis system outer membrane secretion channel CsgG